MRKVDLEVQRVWERKYLTKVMVDNMFAIIQNPVDVEYDAVQMKELSKCYKRLKDIIHEDYLEIAEVIQGAEI